MLSAPPENNLLGTDGLPRFGYFASPVTRLNLAQFTYYNVMDRPASALAKYLHYKQFQFVSISHADWQIGVAIADIRYAASAFCYFYQRSTQQLDEISLLKPFSLGVQMSNTPVAGSARINGKQHICLTPKGYNWQLTLQGELLSGNLMLHGGENAQPIALCTPTGYNGWTYTQKHNALALSGELHYRGTALDLSTALAGYDFSAGYMRRETSWRWGSISATLPQGRFGLNLANGVNETGATENCLWLDGRLQLLPPVSIGLNRQQPTQPWQFSSTDQQVCLQFTPQQCRRERLNLGILASNFRQYCGFFSGSILLQNGEKLILDQVPGLAEDHFARW
ncbi:DUF2804 domain-containing protein [Rheinheimera sp.]|uniref:DUF2804 domain-containing protein n=1 Tax=Rheinheimera sp. TaxID=1869214 RepID=UPI002732B773|nr:DUF2804 domain-containing protein [Rheinheimera sp.]MDP2715056.1 DUF2804 domain-containing protein [Rheinheimera sp.]